MLIFLKILGMTNYLNSNYSNFSKEYKEYLNKFSSEITHKGYFSIDKKTKHIVDDKKDISDDISAYELILKDKERLLSFKEPTRFIFSHSALREGWDNPNIFQICILRHSNSEISKRQEVGRGLRLCVNDEGVRIDFSEVGDDVHKINELTVITNESYNNFVASIQNETVLRSRSIVINTSLFEGKTVGNSNHVITEKEAKFILFYLESNEYLDDKNNISDQYLQDYNGNKLKPLPKLLESVSEDLHYMLYNVAQKSINVETLISNGNKTKAPINTINQYNLQKKEWQELWNRLKHKYTYLVSYDSNELISKSINAINNELFIPKLSYTITQASQDKFDKFIIDNTSTKYITNTISAIKYDLVGDIAKESNITRQTSVKILKGIDVAKFNMFKDNPEQFIRRVSEIINIQKSSLIVAHISYKKIDDIDTYDLNIFTKGSNFSDWDKIFVGKKHITNYFQTDGISANSVEKRFAEDLDNANEVAVYAKLPKSFKIPTPLGNYTPDWAIAFINNGQKHIYFVAETKGSLESYQLRKIESAKIECANKLFNKMNITGLRYYVVASYKDLLDAISCN